MKAPLLLCAFVISTIAFAFACGHPGYEASQTTTITGAPMLTTGPGVGEPELTRQLGPLSKKVALAVCHHEINCGRRTSGVNDATTCMDEVIAKSSAELTTWRCSPAAIRARIEECLAAIPEESCELDLTRPERHICRGNDACTVSTRE